MKKTKEELNELKQECEEMSIKLRELTDEELDLVTGGFKDGSWGYYPLVVHSTFAGANGRSTNFTVDGANFNNNFGLSDKLPGGGNPIS